MKQEVVAQKDRVPWTTKFVYGIGTIAFGIKDNGFNALLMIYYNQVIGLPAAWVGAAIMIAMVADAVLDPVVGQCSDSIRTKWGRRHPFMYASILPVGIFYLLLWLPPAGASDPVLFAWLLLIASATRIMIGVYEIPSTALLAEFTQDYDERTELVAFRFFFGVIGGILMGIFVFTVIFADEPTAPGGLLDPVGYSSYAWIAAPLMATAIFISSIGTHRQIAGLDLPPPPPRQSLLTTAKDMVATLFHRVNAPILIGSIFGSMSGGLNAALTIYMQTYFWELSANRIAVLTASGLLGMVLAFIIVLPLSKWFGKKWTTLSLYALTLAGITIPVGLRHVGCCGSDPYSLHGSGRDRTGAPVHGSTLGRVDLLGHILRQQDRVRHGHPGLGPHPYPGRLPAGRKARRCGFGHDRRVRHRLLDCHTGVHQRGADLHELLSRVP
jgi:Na+/melibiose symporter-like transporter